jgi:hypothetical protein
MGLGVPVSPEELLIVILRIFSSKINRKMVDRTIKIDGVKLCNRVQQMIERYAFIVTAPLFPAIQEGVDSG